jgi:hypothetical protein
MWRYNDFLGFYEVSFYDKAMVMFSDKMQKIWNKLIEEYNKLNDNCLKRELLNSALKIVKLYDLFPDLYQADIYDFGNGEFYKLAMKIEFAKKLVQLDVGESYIVEYTLKSIFSDSVLPEKITWTSSMPTVAEINSDGKVIARSQGKTIIKGKFCKSENTFEVMVGKLYNCEEYYCENSDYKCFSGVYTGTGALIYDILDYTENPCEYYTVRDHMDILINLGNSDAIGHIEGKWFVKTSLWNSYKDKCEIEYSSVDNLFRGPIIFSCQEAGSFIYSEYPYTFQGSLYNGSLILEVDTYVKNNKKHFTTQIHCHRIDY